MAKRKAKKKKKDEQVARIDTDPFGHQPFKGLSDLKIEPEPAPLKPIKPDKPDVSEESFFKDAMAGVAPLRSPKSGIYIKKPNVKPPDLSPVEQEDLKVLAELENLVSGRSQFEIVDTDEYIEGYVRGIHPMLLEKLRNGRFSVQAYLDLHGLTVKEAEVEVRIFIDESISLKHSCVLLVHGRGINSKDNIPIIKQKLKAILLKGPVRKKILAFTSAKPHDGGAGASYLLLRAAN